MKSLSALKSQKSNSFIYCFDEKKTCNVAVILFQFLKLNKVNCVDELSKYKFC